MEEKKRRFVEIVNTLSKQKFGTNDDVERSILDHSEDPLACLATLFRPPGKDYASCSSKILTTKCSIDLLLEQLNLFDLDVGKPCEEYVGYPLLFCARV